jgi:hypothetical protein
LIFYYHKAISIVFLFTILSFLSYIYPATSIIFIPYICYKMILFVTTKRSLKIVFCYFLFFLTFSLPIVLWCFFYEQCTINIFFYYIILLCIILLIILMLTILFKRMLTFLRNQISIVFAGALFISLLSCALYYAGYFFTPGCIFPACYFLTPLSYFHYLGLPFFFKNYIFIYYFLYQIIIFFIFNSSRLYFLYIFFAIFCLYWPIKKNDYYWDKDTILPYTKYKLNDNTYVFPESMFTIETDNDISSLVLLAQKEHSTIIAGIQWYEKIGTKLIHKNGVIHISSSGKYRIREKQHYLRFCETSTEKYYNNNSLNDNSILICSEFFLAPLYKHINSKVIIIASTNWTNEKITFLYKYIMHRIYDCFLLE